MGLKNFHKLEISPLVKPSVEVLALAGASRFGSCKQCNSVIKVIVVFGNSKWTSAGITAVYGECLYCDGVWRSHPPCAKDSTVKEGEEKREISLSPMNLHS